MSDKCLYKREILEAIDHLRARKARPDINRIKIYLSKRHGLSHDTITNALSKCVDQAIVFRVEYKGYISYRNAAKSCHGKLTNNDNESTAGEEILKKAYTAVANSAEGAAVCDFMNTLLKQNEGKDNVYLKKLLDDSISNRYFIKLENGNVILKEDIKLKSSSSKQTEIRNKKSNPKNCKSLTPKSLHKHRILKSRISKDRYRSVNHRKRILKKIFDPTEDHVIRKAKKNNAVNKLKNRIETATLQTPEYRICAVCQKLITTDKDDNKVVLCGICSSKSHYACAYSRPDMTKLKLEEPWTCPQCISCKTCRKTSITSPLIMCVHCSAAYHRKCHKPQINEKIDSESFWLCQSCENKNDKNNENAKVKYFCSPGHIPRRKYELSEHKTIWQKFKQRLLKFGAVEDVADDTVIPDVKDWTSDQVFNYIFNHLPEAAPSFKERNINGPHLLNMSRIEVIQGLGLKLGPALKAYKQVIILQRRMNDPKLYYL